MEKILITLPGFQRNGFLINLTLIDLVKKYPEKFYDGLKIECVYDNFPCLWGGGRVVPFEHELSKEEIESWIGPFLARGVKVRFNFTNTLLEEKHLKDRYSNELLKKCIEVADKYNSRIGIVIFSDLLKQYLETNYPSLDFVWSTTLGQIGLDETNRRSKDNLLVIDYMYNNNFEFLKQLKYPEHIEVLANEWCVPNCPHRKLHFDFYSAINLGRIDFKKHEISPMCIWKDTNIDPEVRTIQCVEMEDFIDKYLPLGIHRLKMVGRMETVDMLADQYSNWLAKPEYQKEIEILLGGHPEDE